MNTNWNGSSVSDGVLFLEWIHFSGISVNEQVRLHLIDVARSYLDHFFSLTRFHVLLGGVISFRWCD